MEDHLSRLIVRAPVLLVSGLRASGSLYSEVGSFDNDPRYGGSGYIDGRSSTVGDDQEETASGSGRAHGRNGSHVVSSDGREFHREIFDG